MNALKYSKSKPLFMYPDHRFSLDQTNTLLKKAYSKNMPVLVYIHGRAKGIGEPRKSVEQKIYKELKSYGVVVIGFTWDADDGGYDISRPASSADDFDKFLHSVQSFLDQTNQQRPSLLAHSMGNIILSELAKDDLINSDRGKIFDNIVFNAPAVIQKRHHKWLRKIGISERIYIMINPKDKALLFAGFMFRPNMLGREINPPGVGKEKANYIYLKGLGVNHRYFVKSKQKKQNNLYEFFKNALAGKEVELESIAVEESIRGIPVNHIISTNKIHEAYDVYVYE